MSDPYVVELSPDKPNFFLVCEPFTSLTEIFKPIADSLSGLERIIVFCEQISLCNEIYSFFCMFLVTISQSLQKSRFGILKLGSWMSLQQELMKGIKNILINFASPIAPVQTVITTIAFGMGID